ncbi:hypothetical protein AGOR_G00157990 [Albula goreensis]|uniref:IRF tryptophan pentad repeat domain-containing protein n=1 Tax=Albula goreensis TaxID=1534307 RepID=A0A8T3D563_9TELE|nr:hypothetical protein AGOR_G00157990 [Albula goreensis]
MEEVRKNMRLKEWLIAQIDSGKYTGLHWENREKSMFRIPWKHAAKHDYSQNEDAALFKAWAMFKGKYREGRDKADPSVWKTRLRCALNKSLDFQEVAERSQLDIPEPYKVYKVIQAEGLRDTDSSGSPVLYEDSLPGTVLSAAAPVSHKLEGEAHSDVDVGQRQSTDCEAQQSPVCMNIWTVPTDNEGHRSGKCLTMRAAGFETFEVTATYPSVLQITDLRLHVCLYYQGRLVRDFTTSTPEGCWILHGTVPAESEQIYGPSTVESLHFPLLEEAHLPPKTSRALASLLPHLQRGVLLWAAPDGVFIKRFCQARVYWAGPLAPHRDLPNKLEREKTYKVLDTAIFFKEVQQFLQQGGPTPQFQIDLCFGEEFPDSGWTVAQKLITAHVEPLFAFSLMGNIQRSAVEATAGIHANINNKDDVPRITLC